MSTSKSWLQTFIGILIGLVFSGILLIVIRSPRGQPIELAPSPTKAPVTVHISGAVVMPGVYSLSDGSRVSDLVDMAGGFAGDADRDSVNLAEYLTDGTKVHILSRSITSQNAQVDPQQQDLTPVVPTKININTANLEELDTLPGIGPAKAEQIIAYRLTNGKFFVIEDIMNVPGIGSSLFEEIENYIVVE